MFHKNKRAFYIWIIVLLAIMFTGLYAIILGFKYGHEEVYNTSQWVPWGILISTYVFFVVSSTGMCLISSFGHVFGVKRYELIGRRGIFLAIITLIAGFTVIGAELERPWRLFIYALFSPNINSAIWWMGFLYSLYLLFIVIEFFFLSVSEEFFKKSKEIARLAGATGVIVAISAHSTLGAVFGFVETRPLWYGPYAPIYFILSAFLSGAAMLAFVIITTYKLTKKEMSSEMQSLMVEFGKLLALLIGITLFFAAWKIIVGLYGHPIGKYEIMIYLLKGPLSVGYWGFEILLGSLIPFFILLYPKTRTIKGVFVASFLVIIGIFMVRYDFVIAGQLIPVLGGENYTTYFPSLMESLIVAGAFALCALLYTIGEKILPLEEAEH